MEILLSVLGPQAKELAERLEKDDPEVALLVEEVATDRIWSRKELPLREKSILTIAANVSLQRWDQVEVHMKSFLHLGGKKRELREMMIHLSIYCGFPAMLNGLKVLNGLKS